MMKPGHAPLILKVLLGFWLHLMGSASQQIAANELILASIFNDHCVLQQDRPIVVWGRSEPGDVLHLRLAGQESVTTADGQGHWRVALPARSASFERLTLKVSSEKTRQQVAVDDVLIGEVWHASGQSNMEMTVGAMIDRLPILKEAIDKNSSEAIRFCRLNAPGSATSQVGLPERANWKVGSSEAVPSFSGVAYYFARRLQDSLRVPIGILDSSRGGTPIEPFIPREAFSGHPTLERELELGDANDLVAITELAGGVWARDDNWLPGRLFHSRIHAVQQFATRGVIWYQGESNCGDGEDARYYQFKMRALIRGWRAALQNESLPFYYVQLPGSGARESWPYLREQQRLALGLAHTGMAVTIDLSEDDIHPANKVDVGQRLARLALRDDYHQSLVATGPLFREVRFSSGKATIFFDHAENGLMVATKQGLEPPQPSTDIKSVPLLELADQQGRWSPARAEIHENTVTVTNDNGQPPIAVRYAYEISPQGPFLYNSDGLPAAPFCSSPQLLDGTPTGR